MLIHKATLGVLEYAPWDGTCHTFNDKRLPVLRPATMAGLGLSPDEWWQVRNGSALALAIRRCYPFFSPVVEAGELVGAEPWPAWQVYGEEPPPEPAPPPRRRRPRRRAGLTLG